MGKKKKEILDKEYVPFRDGMKANGYSDGAIKTLWDILVPFSDYAFNQAHTAGYGLVSLLDGLPQGELPGRVHGGAAHQRPRRQGQVRALPRRVPPHGHQGAAARRQRLRRRLHPARHRHPLRADRDPQRRRQRRRPAIVADPRARRAGSPTSPTSCARSRPPCCNKKTVESLVKAGAFDSLGHTRKGLHGGARRGHRRVHGHQARRGDRAVRPVRQHGRRGRPTTAPASSTSGSRSGSGTRRCCSPTSGRCSGSTSPTTRCSASSTCSPAPSTARCPRIADRDDGCAVTVGGILSSVVRKVTKQGNAWALVTLEDLEGAVEVMFFPATYQAAAVQLVEDAVVLVRGRVDKREDVPKIVASELIVPDLSTGPRGPVVVSLPTARCTPPVVERLKEVLGRHPGTTEVHLQLHQRRARRPWSGSTTGCGSTAGARAVRRPQGAARRRLPAGERLMRTGRPGAARACAPVRLCAGTLECRAARPAAARPPRRRATATPTPRTTGW